MGFYGYNPENFKANYSGLINSLNQFGDSLKFIPEYQKIQRAMKEDANFVDNEKKQIDNYIEMVGEDESLLSAYAQSHLGEDDVTMAARKIVDNMSDDEKNQLGIGENADFDETTTYKILSHAFKNDFRGLIPEFSVDKTKSGKHYKAVGDVTSWSDEVAGRIGSFFEPILHTGKVDVNAMMGLSTLSEPLKTDKKKQIISEVRNWAAYKATSEPAKNIMTGFTTLNTDDKDLNSYIETNKKTATINELDKDGNLSDKEVNFMVAPSNVESYLNGKKLSNKNVENYDNQINEYKKLYDKDTIQKIQTVTSDIMSDVFASALDDVDISKTGTSMYVGVEKMHEAISNWVKSGGTYNKLIQNENYRDVITNMSEQAQQALKADLDKRDQQVMANLAILMKPKAQPVASKSGGRSGGRRTPKDMYTWKTMSEAASKQRDALAEKLATLQSQFDSMDDKDKKGKDGIILKGKISKTKQQLKGYTDLSDEYLKLWQQSVQQGFDIRQQEGFNQANKNIATKLSAELTANKDEFKDALAQIGISGDEQITKDNADDVSDVIGKLLNTNIKAFVNDDGSIEFKADVGTGLGTQSYDVPVYKINPKPKQENFQATSVQVQDKQKQTDAQKQDIKSAKEQISQFTYYPYEKKLKSFYDAEQAVINNPKFYVDKKGLTEQGTKVMLNILRKELGDKLPDDNLLKFYKNDYLKATKKGWKPGDKVPGSFEYKDLNFNLK